MSELISGKVPLNNWYDGIETEVQFLGNMNWYPLNTDEVSLDDFKDSGNKFRLRPRTIALNGVEIEKPKEIINDPVTGSVGLIYGDNQKSKEAMEALRSIFNVK